jgi:hypothetical protein
VATVVLFRQSRNLTFARIPNLILLGNFRRASFRRVVERSSSALASNVIGEGSGFPLRLSKSGYACLVASAVGLQPLQYIGVKTNGELLLAGGHASVAFV